MTITYILFDLYGTLVDSRLMIPCYARQLGIVMAERYGSTADAWEDANRRVVADWDSYYADLDFEGDNDLDDMWEGMIRTTRALFRLTGTLEPDSDEMAALSRELPYLATSGCDALFPEARSVIERLHSSGFILGIASHTTTTQARGTLTGAGILSYFEGPILGPDVTGVYTKNRRYYLAAQLPPEKCLVVDDSPEGIRGAKAAGMQAILIHRGDATSPDSPADHVLRDTLEGLLDYLGL